MRFPFVVLLALVLSFGVDGTAGAQPQPPLPGTGLRSIELRAGVADAEPVLHIRPDISTVLTFDVKLARAPSGRLQVELERSTDFTRVDLGEFVLRLVPSGALKPGDRLQLIVRFEDEAAPQKATFVLVVTEDRPDRLVEVSHESRPGESFPPEVREAWAAVRQCQEALARVQTAPGGLTALLRSGVLADSGVVTRNLPEAVTRWQGSAFVAKQLRTYRSERRVLVELSLRARGPGAPWMARNASLVGRGGELLNILSVWQELPVTMDESRRILVEAEADVALSPDSWTLWLSEDGGGRAVVMGHITFAPVKWNVEGG